MTAAAAMLDNHYIYHVIARQKPGCEINSRLRVFSARRGLRDNQADDERRAFLERCQSAAENVRTHIRDIFIHTRSVIFAAPSEPNTDVCVVKMRHGVRG